MRPSRKHGAGAALAGFAALLRAGQAEVLAEEAQERRRAFDLPRVLAAVDGDRDLHHFTSCSSRRVKTSTMCSRYSLLQRRSLIGLIAPPYGGHDVVGRVGLRQPVDEDRRRGARADPDAQDAVLLEDGDADDPEVVAFDPLELAVAAAAARALGRHDDASRGSRRAARTVRLTPVKNSLNGTSRSPAL